jgi:hypothetical protein
MITAASRHRRRAERSALLRRLQARHVRHGLHPGCAPRRGPARTGTAAAARRGRRAATCRRARVRPPCGAKASARRPAARAAVTALFLPRRPPTPPPPPTLCPPFFQPRLPPGAWGAFYYEGYGGGAAYLPSRVVVHPAYSGYEWNGDNEFDVAVVFLKECVKLGPNVQPIQLATKAGARWGRGGGAAWRQRIVGEGALAGQGGRRASRGGTLSCFGLSATHPCGSRLSASHPQSSRRPRRARGLCPAGAPSPTAPTPRPAWVASTPRCCSTGSPSTWSPARSSAPT